MEDDNSVQLALDRLLNEDSVTVEVGNELVSCNWSTGSAIFPEQGTSIAALFEEADTHMYTLKHGKQA